MPLGAALREAAVRTATWQVSVPADGLYRVYAKWPTLPGLASDAPYSIAHDGGSSAVTVNQRENGGAWVLLGSYDYSAGQSYDVSLSDAANGAVVADALYLVAEPGSAGRFVWEASLPAAGAYELYARWPADSGRTAAASYCQRRLQES